MTNNEPLSSGRKMLVGVQYLFVAFGATVLVPLLVGLSPSTALFSAGVGTLIFHLITKGKVPIFLGSSFAFIAPIISATESYGSSGALFGLIGVAFVYVFMSMLIKGFGMKFIKKLFPPIVIGPIIMLIGLSLSGAAVNMAKENWWLAIASLTTAILVTLYAKGLFKLIPIFLAIIVGYILDLSFFEVDLEMIREASWFALPDLEIVRNFSDIAYSELSWSEWLKLPLKIVPAVKGDASIWEPILFMIPVAIAPVIEHIGDVYVVNSVTGKRFTEDPGLHRTMLGDGLACFAAALCGGPPVTTYSEVTGAMSLTKVTTPSVFRVAAVTAIIFSMIGKVSALLQTIDHAILGGIMLLLFGTIAGAGITSLLNSKVNFASSRNVVILSVTLTTGIGGAIFEFGGFKLAGIGLSAIIAVILNLLLPETAEDKLIKAKESEKRNTK